MEQNVSNLQLRTKRFLILACTLICVGIVRIIYILSEGSQEATPVDTWNWDILSPLFITISMIIYAIGLLVKLKKEHPNLS